MKLFLSCLLFCIAVGSGRVSNAQAFRLMSDSGLSFSATDITQDHEGFIWFATTYGLYRYDSRYAKRYLSNRSGRAGLPTDYLSAILCDSQNRLWIGSWKGLILFNREHETFTTFAHIPGNPASISNDTIYCLFEDSRKQLWIGTEHGLSLAEDTGEGLKFRHFLLDSTASYGNAVRAISEDQNGDLWLATSAGLARLSRKEHTIERFLIRPDSKYPPDNEIGTVYCYNDGSVWAGMRAGGLNRFDPVGKRFEPLPLLVSEKHRNAIVTRFLPDQQGKIWIPTWEGLACYDPGIARTTWYVNESTDPLSLPDNSILSGYIDRQQGLWLGGYNEGVGYFQVKSRPILPWFLPRENTKSKQFDDGWYGINKNDEIWSVSPNQDRLLIFDKNRSILRSYQMLLPHSMRHNHFFLDEPDVLWCGGSSILSRLDLKTGRRDDYPLLEHTRKTGIVRRVLGIENDRLLLLGSFGAFIFDKRSREFQPTGIEKVVGCGSQDSRGNIWLGGNGKVFMLRKDSGALETFETSMPDEIRKTIWRITEDARGRIWFITGYGLWLLDEPSRNFLPYHDFDQDFFLTDMMSDKDGFLWLSAERQLVRFNPDTRTTRYFGEADGLPHHVMLRVDEAFSNREGTFFYPTNKGTFFFNPGNIPLNDTPSGIVVSSLKLFNKKIELTDSTGIFKNEISTEKSLVFKHSQNIFTLDFAHLSYFKSDQNQYAYKLEGFEKDWNYVKIPSATYTNLPAGSYTFIVKAANGDGYWSPELLKLQIVTLPPWWKTWYAYLLYTLVLAGILYAISRFFWLRRVVRQENELYQAKLDFFTNISHEIRTHLSLISGPVEKAWELSANDDKLRGFLTYARNNSDRLLLLVNELLDFRKIQNNQTRLWIGEYNVTATIANTLTSFEHLASQKCITASLEGPEHPVMLWFDLSQIQKVFYNLLGNAFKFTPENGCISVRIMEDLNSVTIKVSDNGPGIAPQYIDRLFTNFFQVYENNTGNTGYGIGLALSYEIVARHQGKLMVDSKQKTEAEDGETCFSLMLLKGRSHLPASDLAKPSPTVPPGKHPVIDENTASPDDAGSLQKYSILLIDDNDELRAFTGETLREVYQVMEAGNGRNGLELAREHMPDLIICDVMMPGLNGLEVCKTLRSEFQTRHIPIILVSARSTTQQMMEGFQAGADAYLIKPFDFRVLELQIANLIRTRETLKEKNSRSILMEPGELVGDNPDEEFIARLRDLVVENISDAGFGVNEIAFKIGISVSVLYRKLRALTGLTVNEFIKNIRMKRAMQILESESYHVNEVANMVGFEDSKYFSKEFTRTFKKKPSDVKKGNKQGRKNA